MSDKTRWQEKREASYEALVRSAMRTFHECGYAATRVEDIVAGTGYTPGAFYFHFKNKAVCFRHVIEFRERQRESWQQRLEGLGPRDADLETLLRETFAYLWESADNARAWILVVVDFFQQHRGDEEVAEELAAIYRGWRDELAAFVRALQAGGWIGTRRDPAVLATEVLAYFDGLTTHRVVFGLGEDAYRAALLEGVATLLSGGG